MAASDSTHAAPTGTTTPPILGPELAAGDIPVPGAESPDGTHAAESPTGSQSGAPTFNIGTPAPAGDQGEKMKELEKKLEDRDKEMDELKDAINDLQQNIVLLLENAKKTAMAPTSAPFPASIPVTAPALHQNLVDLEKISCHGMNHSLQC